MNQKSASSVVRTKVWFPYSFSRGSWYQELDFTVVGGLCWMFYSLLKESFR